ncbi:MULTISPECIES: dihydroxyacetone kinase subunit DhaL [Bradyrhizobium]|uniref:Dihydroxyacetone kinase subunit DhaL n=1 Tax=Bradyrhizobium brasilense TaxID=1419277 RepID=A0ABY8JKE3_9BRAD|nr:MULTISPECIES: dihydroxyacetone kinase subunit DhaL [Bradyrhizobium]MCP1913738.1 dihydroxyacetone kinase-like protein [Bradyrhizobium elkanii]KRP85497.1 dihydroxyacetone kinase [Bradyrhizobium pachyrhizi]MCA1396293.1 dihydroxyacetone kinase subunit L [Bradyrhizobium sp. BRP56]MCC8946383.1 dihydroxyacetone kinase subunit L [Bradyrhizobium brasilense]MCP1831019.1 dihydroxyacetone kinase-like protein [Bradyrhizobium sp. USDA 4545]
MSVQPETFKSLLKAAAEQVIASAPELTSLDQAIGDGDHGTNMKRGFEAVLGKLDAISAQPLNEAFKAIGKTLVMTVGGASGPLYGSFFLAAGEALSQDKHLPDDLADVFGSGVDAVSARGRSQAGEKTMLDVLVPVLETLKAGAGQPDLIERVRITAAEAVERTVPMQATKGRASFLGARSVGHVDPGARSSCVLLHAVCAGLEARQ